MLFWVFAALLTALVLAALLWPLARADAQAVRRAEADVAVYRDQLKELEADRVRGIIGEAEARLREHPDDGKGWDVLAPVYLRQERYEDAIHAYTNAIRLLGETS